MFQASPKIKFNLKMEQKRKERRTFLCRNSVDRFCYVCGLFTSNEDSRSMNAVHRRAYSLYFKKEVDQTPSWVPNVICGCCRKGFERWLKGAGHLTFGSPMIWREPFNHINDCYFCNTELRGASMVKRFTLNYADVSTVTKTIPHSEHLPIPKPPIESSESDQSIPNVTTTTSSSSSFSPEDVHRPKFFSQAELNDLIRDLALSKRQAELLGSRLQERNLLQKGKKEIFDFL